MVMDAMLLLSVCVGVCDAFNLDTSSVVIKTGTNGSLFGLSVALHRHLTTDTHMLLVGAPRERAEPNVPANRTGGVYSCPITASQSDCRRMVLVDPDVNPSEDLVEDMWLGVSVVSQGPPGGRVLACGHRFVKLYGAFKLRHMIGRCYLRGNDLQYNISDLPWMNPDQPCSYLGDVRAEVMCNGGVSAFITQTDVIIGSPGSFEWQGNVHVSWMNPDVDFDTQKTSFPSMQRRNIYIGYSVIQDKRLLSQDDDTVVTGAPKDGKDDARGSVLMAAKRSGRLVTLLTLRGQQTGSYFGNAVTTTDVDGDGWNDLLVGAPFYFQRVQEAGGAVYLYINKGGMFDSSPSAVLTGRPNSGFGMSVCATGDLDGDGFEDFAVGAPFDQSGGAVIIWTGNEDGAFTEPSQVIQGSSISPRFSTFGYSLSSGLDVDGNKYPDLLVGSLDDTVALLRARPVLHLTPTLRVSPDIVDPKRCDFCVQVEVCLSHTFSRGEEGSITVRFTVSADIISLKSRLNFHDNGQSVFSGFLTLPKVACRSLRVGLLNPIRNLVDPLLFSLNVSLVQKIFRKKNSTQDLRRFPVLSRKPEPVRAQIHFQKFCGSDNRCHSNLQMWAQFTDQNHRPLPQQAGSQLLNYSATIRSLFLQVNVTNSPSPGRPAEDAHNAALSVSIPPSLLYSGVQTKGGGASASVECSTEDGRLLCELGNPFRSEQEVKLLIKFQPSGITLNTGEIHCDLLLTTLSQQSDLSPLSVSMSVIFSLQASLTLIRPPGPAYFSSHVTGESAMKETEHIGEPLEFTLQVNVYGKPLGRHGNLELEFDWPMETKSGKWLLYLTEIRLVGTSLPHCSPGDIINPLRLPVSERKRRSLTEGAEQRNTTTAANLQRRRSYALDCVSGARCVTFSCPLHDIIASATVTVRARLWGSTMIEDFSDAQSLSVRLQTMLRLKTDKPTVHMEPLTSEVEVHVYPESGLQLHSGAPVWMLVVSMVVGVVVLALLCLLLWKCGFFRTASRRELYRTQTAHLKTQITSQTSTQTRI